MNPPQEAVLAAIQQANSSPCAKSHRGAVVFTASENVLSPDDSFSLAIGIPSAIGIVVACAMAIIGEMLDIAGSGVGATIFGAACGSAFIAARASRARKMRRECLPANMILSAGTNMQPPGFACDGSTMCKANCGRLCEHAEASALRRLKASVIDCDMLHIKTVNGEPVTSGDPSCMECSKAILADGRISGVWLLHDEGWRRYNASEFHELSIRSNDIVVGDLGKSKHV
jgi:hypothetical protein